MFFLILRFRYLMMLYPCYYYSSDIVFSRLIDARKYINNTYTQRFMDRIIPVKLKYINMLTFVPRGFCRLFTNLYLSDNQRLRNGYTSSSVNAMIYTF